MLTEHDRTVPGCLDIMDEIRSAGLTHIGCKEVGVDSEILPQLVRAINDAGATSYLELVSTRYEDCVAAVEMAIDSGVERLLGGLRPADLQKVCDGRIQYYPFPGTPEGHPTILRGSADQVAEHCRRYSDQGCPGVDLLAYRAVDADPLDLVRAARSATDGYIICAGSVDSPERIRALHSAGADAFTIGSAVFDGSFCPDVGDIREQIEQVLEATPD